MPDFSTVPAVLDGVLSLLAVPDHWARAAAARNALGHPVPVDSNEAVAWSLDGAIERVIGYWEDETITEDEAERRLALESATFTALGVNTAAMNDAAGYRNVIALLKAARSRSFSPMA
ncbi:hypothetical protein OCOJLMKI_0506 [Methylobacterium iners]|uniref:Uncharacterized protein n=2 Tax=Methylobacterium iners TaxID=418707 RepID=A0ABQ4RUC9_9HYPH|nr:hypothetical protein OCOJLMKI_0506 [Methylobacterium iners]